MKFIKLKHAAPTVVWDIYILGFHYLSESIVRFDLNRLATAELERNYLWNAPDNYNLIDI